MQNLDSIILFPVDRLLKNEMRGGKGDLKRPFERSWKDYNEKFAELERQKKKAAREAGKEIKELDFFKKNFSNTKRDEFLRILVTHKTPCSVVAFFLLSGP